MDIVRLFKINAAEYPINIKGDPENPLFQASHVAKVFGIVKIRTIISKYNDAERVTLKIDVNNPFVYNDTSDKNEEETNKQDTIFLTEQGVTRLIFNSRKPEVKEFKKWITQITKEVATQGKYIYEQKTLIELEANKKIIRKERHHALVRAFEKNFIVYLVELEDFTPKYKDPNNPNDTSRIIKIGSTKNIKKRLDGLKRIFGECTLIDCYKCVCYEDFENYLFHHKFIKPNFIQIIEGKRETYKFDDDIYTKVIDIIKSDIDGFNNITIEEVVEKVLRDSELTNAAYKYKIAKEERLKTERDIIKSDRDAINAVIINKAKTISTLAETEKLREVKNLKILELMTNNTNNTNNPIIIAMMNKQINVKVSDFDSLGITDTTKQEDPENPENPEDNHESEIEAEIEQHLETLNDDDIPEEAPKGHDTYVNVMNELNPIENKSCKGPLVQQYDPFNLQLIKTFNGFIDAIREVDGTSAAGIRAAVKAHSVYHGFRWHAIPRDAEPIQYEIPPTVGIQQSKRGLIAMLDLDKAHILNVFESLNAASRDQKFSNGAAISKAIHRDTKSGNKFWKRWEDCDEVLRNEYLEHHKLPEIEQVGSGYIKINQYHPISRTFIKTFNSMADITKNYQMSRITLFKAIATQKPTKGFVWNYLNQPVSL
jgi:prophage antirepressor-like protein